MPFERSHSHMLRQRLDEPPTLMIVVAGPRQIGKSTLVRQVLVGRPALYDAVDVSIVSVVELVWVLTRCYSSTRGEICAVLETLLRTKEIVVAHANTVWEALRLLKDGKADFAD